LLHSGVVDRRLNDAAVREYFLCGSVQAPATLIQDVLQLMPGHSLVLSRGRLEIRRYWHLAAALEADDGKSDRDYVEQVEAILQDAVSRHLVSDVPLGVFLSGGIDSSAIVALMQGQARGRTTTLSVIFDEKRYDERRFSREIARKYATQHVEIMVRQADILADLPQIFDAMDQPSVDGFNTFVISKVARRSGLTVALSGLGADEIFAGYSLFTTLPRIVKYSRLAHLLPGGLLGGLRSLLSAAATSRKGLKAVYSLEHCCDLSAAHSLLRTIFLPAEVARLTVGLGPGERRVVDPRPVRDPVNHLSGLEIDGYLHNTLLHDTDRMSMAHSLEVRVPFLDHVLVEAVAGTPGRLKVGGGIPKRLLVHAMGEHLPVSVYRRGKKGFTFPFDLWLRRELRDYCEAKLSVAALQRIPVLDTQAVRRMWEQYLQGSRRYTDACILAFLSFVNWYERHMTEPRSSSTPATRRQADPNTAGRR
jgi:asparagine synthase (glutamine-hydrolysing)